MLPEAWRDVSFDAFLGFRGEGLAYQLDVFNSLCEHVHLCSDDGTLGEKPVGNTIHGGLGLRHAF